MAADTIITYDLVASPQAESKLRAQLTQLEQRMKFRGPFGGLAADTTKFNTELDRATQRVITLGTAFGVLSAAARTFREIVRSTVEVEKALTDINAVFKLTNENLGRFAASMFDVGRETAKSFEEVTKAATEFARQGLSVAKTQEAVRAALILSRDANIDVADSVKALTAATNSFVKEGLSYGQVVNRLAAADSAFAVSSKDLQESLIRVGSAASDAGISFNELIGLVTSAQQITARGGSVIAGALNTIFTRVNRKDTLDALDALGVAVTDVQGRMLPTLTVLQNFSRAYDNMTGSVKNQAAELVGGVRQLNTLKAVLDDLSKSNSVFAQTQLAVASATDEAERRNAARNQSLSARFEQLKTTGTQVAANVGSLGFSKNVGSALSGLADNPITNMLKNAGDPTNESFGAEFGRAFIKGFGGAVSYGLLPILAVVLGKLGSQVLGNLTQDIKGIVGLKTATQERAAVEQQIVALYKAGGVALQEQLAVMSSLTERAALLRNLQAATVSGPGNLAPLATAVMQQGGFRRTPRAAGGYVPMAEEAAAIAAGVGGAPSSARPVFLPSFNRGGGQQGIVANTSEFIVPGAAGGAIYNRAMIQRYGLPPGSTPVAAEGHIPHAAGNWYSVPPSYRSITPQGPMLPPGILGSPLGGSAVTGPGPSNFSGIAMAGAAAAKAATEAAIARMKAWEEAEAQARQAAAALRSTDFTKAQSELAKADALAVKIAQKKAREMEEIAASGASPRRRAMTGSQIDKLDDLTSRALDTVRRTQDAERLAFVEAANFARKQQQSVQNAPITMGSRSVHEIRAIPEVPYQVTNEGIVSSRGGGGGSGGPNDPSRPYGPQIPMWWKVRQMMSARADGATSRQMGLNAATQRLDSGESFGALSATQQALYTNQLRKEAARKLGFDLETVQFNRDARSQVNAMIAPQLAALRAQGQPPVVPIGSPAAAGPTSWQRFLAGARSPTAGIALGLGLPAIGSNINEGVGGTSSGMLRGAASSALNYGGFGASVGMVAGPYGALGGAAIGASFGALYGWVSKSTKSLEEFTAELDQGTKKLSEELNALTSVFRLQDEISAARAEGDEQRVATLRREQNGLVGLIQTPKYKQALAQQLGTADGLTNVAKMGAADVMSKNQIDNLLIGFKGVRSTSINETMGAFGNDTRAGERKAAIQGLLPVLNQMSNEELLGVMRANSESSDKALGLIGAKGGLNPDQIKELQRGAYEYAGDIIIDAMHSLVGNKTARAIATGKTPRPETFNARQILSLASGYRQEGVFGGIDANAAQQVTRVRQQMMLSNPAATEMDRLKMEGSFGLTNISADAEARRQEMLAAGRASLVQTLTSAGITDKRAFGEIPGLNSVTAVSSLQARLNTNAVPGMGSTQSGSINAALQELIDTLQALDRTEAKNLEASERNGQQQREQLLFMRSRKGADAEDLGEAKRLSESLSAATARNDSADVFNPLYAAARTNDLKTRLRSGGITQAQFDAGQDIGAMADRLRDLRRSNSAGRIGADERVGLGFDIEKQTIDQRVTENGINLRVAKNVGDVERIRTLTLEQKALETERLAILGKIDDRQRRILDGIEEQNAELDKSVYSAQILLRVAQNTGADSATVRERQSILLTAQLQKAVQSGSKTEGQADVMLLRNSLFNSQTDSSRQNRATLALARSGSNLLNGSQIEAAALGEARLAGQQGDAQGSFLGGFKARIEGLKRDISDFAEVGNRVAQSLEQNLGNAFGDFVIGAKKGKDAFRDFAVSVLGDASRLFASKAMQAVVSSIPGFGVASGGPMGFAAGGMVPAMLTGGEYVFGPKAVRQIGPDNLRAMNGFGTTHFANGGHVRGGSGVRDDVPANLPTGSFVLRKAAAQRLGPDYLNALASGQVQHRFLGGFLGLPALIGALAGGGIGYATGGKKGALGGALLGGIAGGLYGMNSGGVQMDPATGQRAVLSVTEKAVLGLGASAGLGMLAGGIGAPKDTPGPISLAQVPAYRQQLEREQSSLFGQNPGKAVYLSVNPQGGYSLAGFGNEVATRRWGRDEGGSTSPMTPFTAAGSVDVPLTPMSRVGGGSASQVTINIEINNNGGVSSSTTQDKGDGSGMPDGALERLQKLVKGWTQEELVNQSRSDGFLTQKGRYVNRF